MGIAVSASATERGIREIRRKRELEALAALTSEQVREATEIKIVQLRKREAAIEIRQQQVSRQWFLAAHSALDVYVGDKNFIPPRVTMKAIARRFCHATGVSVDEVMSKRREARIIRVRHAIIYWCYRRTRRSYPEIGAFMGGKDHTTILHAVREYPARRAKDGRHLRLLRPKAN